MRDKRLCRCGNTLERSATKDGRAARWPKYCSAECRAQAYREATPTTVYSFYDSEGQVLYVGVSGNAEFRINTHRLSKEWWPEVATTELEHLPNRMVALEREAELIRSLRPKYNGTIPVDPASTTDRPGVVTIKLLLPDDLLERIDRARGDVPRLVWIRRACEYRLDPEANPTVPMADAVDRAARQMRDSGNKVAAMMVNVPVPCTCGGVIYQVGAKRGQCSKCSHPKEA